MSISNCVLAICKQFDTGLSTNFFLESYSSAAMTYMAMLQHKNSCPWDYEIYNFGRPFLGHHNYILTWSVQCLGVR